MPSSLLTIRSSTSVALQRLRLSLSTTANVSATRYLSNETTNTDDKSSSPSASATLYLHVGPSGDCWTGRSIFAAKHLQPDYVQSIALPDDMDSAALVALLEQDVGLAQEVYDTKKLPGDMANRVQAFKSSER